MHKSYVIMLLMLAFAGLWAFGEAGEQDEIDFLLFLPNSSSRFVNESQAMRQLDTVAAYLRGRNLVSGQIYVYGYAATAANHIEPVALSRNRALFVIAELQKRGLAADLFAGPVAFGAVDLWGDNSDEADMSPNRRVRIMLEDIVLTPALVQPAVPVVEPEPAPVVQASPVPVAPSPPAPYTAEPATPSASFPWWLLLLIPLALIAALLLFAAKRKKRAPGEVPVAAPPPKAPAPPPPAAKPKPVPPAPKEKIKVLEEEEIRLYAYGLYERHSGQNGLDAADWYRSIQELTAYYEAQGFRVILYWKAV